MKYVVEQFSFGFFRVHLSFMYSPPLAMGTYKPTFESLEGRDIPAHGTDPLCSLQVSHLVDVPASDTSRACTEHIKDVRVNTVAGIGSAMNFVPDAATLWSISHHGQAFQLNPDLVTAAFRHDGSAKEQVPVMTSIAPPNTSAVLDRLAQNAFTPLSAPTQPSSLSFTLPNPLADALRRAEGLRIFGFARPIRREPNDPGVIYMRDTTQQGETPEMGQGEPPPEGFIRRAMSQAPANHQPRIVVMPAPAPHVQPVEPAPPSPEQ
jgi:hypothetical protein